MSRLVLVWLLSAVPLLPLFGVAETVDMRPSLEALQETGRLTLNPENPTQGDEVEVVYRSGGLLSSEDRLHLRARLRTPKGDSYNNRAGSKKLTVLQRGEDGVYRGSFTLPEDVVYAALAVEDPQAQKVETPRGGFWEVMVHHPTGVPLADALRQRFNDFMGRDLLAVLESARDLTRHYPDDPNSWTSLNAAESWVYGGKGAEEREAQRRARFIAFEESFANRTELTSHEVGFMYWLAPTDLRAPWQERLVDEHPGHFFAVQVRVMELRLELKDDPEALLLGLEELWLAASDHEARNRILSSAMSTVRRADAETLRLWANRWLVHEPARQFNVGGLLAGNDTTREEGVLLLERAIADEEAAADEARDLGDTRAEQGEKVAQLASAMRRSLGSTLVDAGQVQEGVVHLRKAAEVGWNSGIFRSLGEALLAMGDTEGAMENLVRVAADPSTTNEDAEALRDSVGAQAAEWAVGVQEAEGEMRLRTLDDAIDRELSSAAVVNWDGETVNLLDLMGSQGTVAVFFSRYCGYSHQAMPRIAKLAEELKEMGVPLLAVTDDGAEDAAEYMEENSWDLQVVFDTKGEAAQSFNSWGTPGYFIVDGEGHLRFTSSLDSVWRQLEALAAGH